MASTNSLCNIIISFFFFLAIFSSLQLPPTATAFEFDVGDEEGWKVPPSEKPKLYNSWASKNRFQVDDIINFKYKKDSVMVVNSEDYDDCNSTHPIFFANNGDTSFKLDRPGLFYFISGVSGHCELGQKMIIKVLGQTPAPENSPSPPGGTTNSNAAVSTARIAYIVIMLVIGFLFLEF
ncbi:early nodulin-like protein 6 [Magnolia sinica]|uniref:early nodulin-like protein 6 n=1 Tax=Magnolia sinica TaxID=86752 RepID=UPI00265A950C|nr:early nodulin-like protein 6 [Magnolia sinica]